MPVRGGRLAATAAALLVVHSAEGARGAQDESSPFNECSHAYLAATRALLLHLQTMPGDRTAVRTLIAKIEREMLNNNASLVMCRYSDEPFNTAERILPHWRDIPFTVRV